jgi:hypothetical protein
MEDNTCIVCTDAKTNIALTCCKQPLCSDCIKQIVQHGGKFCPYCRNQDSLFKTAADNSIELPTPTPPPVQYDNNDLLFEMIEMLNNANNRLYQIVIPRSLANSDYMAVSLFDFDPDDDYPLRERDNLDADLDDYITTKSESSDYFQAQCVDATKKMMKRHRWNHITDLPRY